MSLEYILSVSLASLGYKFTPTHGNYTNVQAKLLDDVPAKLRLDRLDYLDISQVLRAAGKTASSYAIVFIKVRHKLLSISILDKQARERLTHFYWHEIRGVKESCKNLERFVSNFFCL